jgi:hypothetical protein
MTQAQEQEFRRFLESVEWHGNSLTEAGIETRISRVKKAEEILGMEIETIVAQDVTMRQALIDLRSSDTHGGRANAVRKYYEMWRGKTFPRIRAAF